jgi:hypothetical protein
LAVSPIIDVSIDVLTTIFRAYLTEQSVDHLSASLKKGGIRDLLAFFPANKRENRHFDDHFRKAGLPQIADWWAKRQYAQVKDRIVKELQEMCEKEETPEAIIAAIKANQETSPIADTELVGVIWQGLMASVDWSARPDQIEGLALREVGVSALVVHSAPLKTYYCCSEIRTHSRAILLRPKSRGGPHQRCTSVLLRRHAHHQSVPTNSQSTRLFLSLSISTSAISHP